MNADVENEIRCPWCGHDQYDVESETKARAIEVVNVKSKPGGVDMDAEALTRNIVEVIYDHADDLTDGFHFYGGEEGVKETAKDIIAVLIRCGLLATNEKEVGGVK